MPSPLSGKIGSIPFWLLSLFGCVLVNASLTLAIASVTEPIPNLARFALPMIVGWLLCLAGLSLVSQKSDQGLRWRVIRLLQAPKLDALFHSQRPARVLRNGLYLGAFLGFVLMKYRVYTLDNIETFPDTWSYARTAAIPATEIRFWTAERPFAVPLLYQVLDLMPSASEDMQAMEAIGATQAWISIVAWLILAVVLARKLHIWWMRIAGFGLILMFSASVQVSQWDRILLSESLSASLFALLTAALAAIPWFQHDPARGKSAFDALATAAAIITSFMLVGTRDSNAYFILLLGILLLGTLVFGIPRNRPWWRRHALLSVAFIGIALMGIRSADLAMRWKLPFLNVFHARIIGDQEAMAHMISQGMEAPELLHEAGGLSRKEFLDQYASDARWIPLDRWINHRGTGAYLSLLLQAPGESLFRPLSDYDALLLADSSEYRSPKITDPSWVTRVSSILFPGAAAIPLGLGIGLAGVGASIIDPSMLRRLLLPIPLLFLVIPMMLVVWHGDSLEIERHAFLITVQLRLALWLSALLIVDHLVFQSRGVPASRAQRPGSYT